MVTSKEILQLVLPMAGLPEVPADTAIYHPGQGITRVLVGLHLGEPELLAAKEMGYHMALTHYPAGGTAGLGVPALFLWHVDHLLPAEALEEKARIQCQPQDTRGFSHGYGDKGKNLVVTGHIANDVLGINPFRRPWESGASR